MSPNRSDGLLARVDFPLYSLQTLTNRHVLVAGGGGASNTGIANGFEVFEISHDGTRFVAEEVMRYETGPNVVMNCSVRSIQNRIYLAAGQESHCQLYRANVKMVDKAEIQKGSFRAENGLRRRRRTISENDNISKKNSSNYRDRQMTFEIRPADSVQSDFGDGPLQRVVRVSQDGKLMATGGTDGVVRLWKFPKMELLYELKEHTKEIDDVDFSPCGERLVSVGKDGQALVWSARGLRPPLLRVTSQPPNGAKYLFRKCRYGLIEESKGEYRLYTIANPLLRTGKQKGLLQSWCPRTGTLRKTVLVAESLSALAVRDDGRFVGVGTMFSGSVDIYVAFSLQRVVHVRGAHMMFVTGVEFVGVAGAGCGSGPASRAEAALLSISVDNCLRVHTLPYRGTIPAWVAVLLIIFVLFCTFTLCSYLDI